jgi:hypothetical protein
MTVVQNESSGSSASSHPLPSWRLCLLHLYGLTAISIAQPLLSRLSGNVAFLETDQIGRQAVWLAAALLCFGFPLLLFLLARIAGMVSPKAGHFVYVGEIGLLLLTGCQSVGQWMARRFNLLAVGIPESAMLIVAVACAAALTLLYLRRESIKGFLTALSACALLVPVSFPLSGQMPGFLFPAEPAPSTAPVITARNPVPVVMIVFDGLNGMALLDENYNLDAARYPGFARLASMSTWYRNASTVHYRTDNAVPAMLTGCLPDGVRLPIAEDHPENLFRMLYDSGQYSMTVFEPYTRLCPRELLPRPRTQPAMAQLQLLLTTLFRVYVDTTLPEELPFARDLIPRSWFGLPADLLFDDSVQTGLLRYSWDRNRSEQFSHFQKCLVRTDKPWFRFLHIVTPHYPWMYTPSGRAYVLDADAGDLPPGTYGVTGEDWRSDPLPVQQAWQRYLMQLGAADRGLDQILDTMQQRKILDESLLIVVADHGVAFRAGITRRQPTGETLSHIMPIPLFVKLPNQTQPHVSDENVETIDIFPTIAEQLQLQPAPVSDGRPLTRQDIPPRPRKSMMGPQGTFVVEPDFPERFEYTDEMTELFGSGSAISLHDANFSNARLIGVSIFDCQIAATSTLKLSLFHRVRIGIPATDDFVPCYLRGTIETPDIPLPAELAVAVDGIIRASTRTMLDTEFEREWAVMLPESIFRKDENHDVRIFWIRSTTPTIVLEECEILP